MKYTEAKKDRSVRRNQSLRWEVQQRQSRVKKDFPVEVYFCDGFLIIESKMNDDVYT